MIKKKKSIGKYWRKQLNKPSASLTEIAFAIATERGEVLPLGHVSSYYADYVMGHTPIEVLIERPKPKVQKKKKPENGGFYQSKEWRILRYKALAKYGRQCMCCGATPESGIILHVDHVKPRSKHPHLSLDINNLQILCEDCNMGKLAWDDTDFRMAMQHMAEITKH